MGWPFRFDEERAFGVELEVIGDAEIKGRFKELAAEAGIEVRELGYTRRCTPCWKIVPDGSVPGGFEVVSPALRGFDGLSELKRVCECLTEAGVSINATCGMHVHHSAADLSGREMSKLVHLYAKFERIIDGLVPPSRRGSNCGYAKTMRQWATLDPMDRAYQERASKSKAAEMAGGRYQKVNLSSWLRHSTVEFRQHSGTHEYPKVEAWLVLTQAMINRAKIGTRVDWQRPASWAYFMSQMFGPSKYHCPFVKRVKSFLEERRKHFRRLGYDENSN